MKYKLEMYQSGTHVVKQDDNQGCWLYVYADKRYEVCLELVDFLNNGIKPNWLEKLKRTSKQTCNGPDGIDISAVGPSYIGSDGFPELRGNEESYLMQEKLIDKLFEGK